MPVEDPQKDRVVDLGGLKAASPGTVPGSEIPDPGLRAQMAALAEQVRQLPSPDVGPATARSATRAEAAPPSPPSAPPRDANHRGGDGSTHLLASVIELAEATAVEIRARAEREAASIRAQAREDSSAPATDLAEALERQRRTIAALTAETGRIEQAAAILRAQISGLDAERQRMSKSLGAARPPR